VTTADIPTDRPPIRRPVGYTEYGDPAAIRRGPPPNRLPDAKVLELRGVILAERAKQAAGQPYLFQHQIGKMFGVSQSMVSQVASGRRKCHVDG